MRFDAGLKRKFQTVQELFKFKPKKFLIDTFLAIFDKATPILSSEHWCWKIAFEILTLIPNELYLHTQLNSEISLATKGLLSKSHARPCNQVAYWTHTYMYYENRRICFIFTPIIPSLHTRIPSIHNSLPTYIYLFNHFRYIENEFN